MREAYQDKGKLEEVLARHPGDEWWRAIDGSNELDAFKEWLREKNIPIGEAYQALREAIVKRQTRNTPDLLLETRSLARKYGFEQPEGFYRALFAEDRYIIVGDNSGHDYVIPMPQREHWDAWIGSDDWAAGVTPPYAMRVEGTLTFKEPSITYD